MALINWNDSLSVGIDVIDRQHKKLCDLVNQLHDAMATGNGNEAVCNIINDLVSYTKEHFLYEESYMKRINFPKINEHKQLHNDLTRQAVELQKKIENSERINVIQISGLLKDWLKNHILKEDMKYAQKESVSV